MAAILMGMLAAGFVMSFMAIVTVNNQPKVEAAIKHSDLPLILAIFGTVSCVMKQRRDLVIIFLVAEAFMYLPLLNEHMFIVWVAFVGMAFAAGILLGGIAGVTYVWFTWEGPIALLPVGGIVALAVIITAINQASRPAQGPVYHNPPLPGAMAIALKYGGDPGYWEPVDEKSPNGWVYYAPQSLPLTVPVGHRIDLTGASCAEPNRGGIYGPQVIGTNHATIWEVPWETRCPS